MFAQRVSQIASRAEEPLVGRLRKDLRVAGILLQRTPRESERLGHTELNRSSPKIGLTYFALDCVILALIQYP